MFSIVVLIVVSLSLTSELILRDGEKTFSEEFVQYDCLDLFTERSTLAYQDLSDVINEVIPYCFRPLLDERSPLVNTRDPSFSFVSLRRLNLTFSDLLRWSSSLNLAEDYQRSSSNLLFFNCSSPWFGRRCEYSFDLVSPFVSLRSLVLGQWSSRSRSPFDVSFFPCYIHLRCDHVAHPMCLTWREICNGQIDCHNDAIDERECFQLEVNECGEDFRCHNGECLEEHFWEKGRGDEAECRDRSDQVADRDELNGCFLDLSFQCEEHSCRTNWMDFPCGDGECVEKFHPCHNGRDRFLLSSTDKCFRAMACLTNLLSPPCSTADLDQCAESFFFPSQPVLFGHLRLLYHNVTKKKDEERFLPDFICYDSTLCDCLRPTWFSGNVSCVSHSQFDLVSMVTGDPWFDLLLSLNTHFRSCLTISPSPFSPSHLYRCANSSKLISRHRIGDENFDCCEEDDEGDLLSCSLVSKFRVRCPNARRCFSSLHQMEDCPTEDFVSPRPIPFDRLCHGFNDENCSAWPCDNLYTRCDGYWTCPHGEDEEKCFDEHPCPPGRHLCLSRMNSTLICLPGESMNDGIDDCLGATDERHFCRSVYPDEKDFRRFRCEHSDRCLAMDELCDGVRTCPLADDERFCDGQHFLCDRKRNHNHTLLQQIFCHHNEHKLKHFDRFILRTAAIYPDEQLQRTNTPFLFPIKHHQEEEDRPIVQSISQSSWFCNRGLIIRQWLGNDTSLDRCLCPPSYYGDRCQFENQRVSLTLKFLRQADEQQKNNVYRFLILLIEDEQRIHSYEQVDYFTSETCSLKIQRYLLFSSRPKNSSANYSIRIDRFDKPLNYRGSWQFPVPHLFLPVHRLAFLLSMSDVYQQIFVDCSPPCLHGQCVRYLNRNHTFCRCHSGWTGRQCTTKLNCTHCSSDSICFGSSFNHSACLCSFDRYGDHCALTWSCPPNTCQNNGQCLFNERRSRETDYQCLCPKEFFGDRCQWAKNQIQLTFDQLEMSSFVIAYFIRLITPEESEVTIMIEKLTLFQNEIHFDLSIPYNLLLIRFNEKLYLAVVQRETKLFLSTSINVHRECPSIDLLFNSSILALNRFDRVKLYHLPCLMNRELECFFDESSLCLCTTDRHGNCFAMNWNETLRCSTTSDGNYCFNRGQCYEDHPTCPSTRLCLCEDCFFGDRCQFYAQGLGLTLDQILIYQVKIRSRFLDQHFSIQLTGALILLIFLLGAFNGLCSLLVFSRRISREVGCGTYLFISSILSLLAIGCLTLKFAFLFSLTSGELLWANCFLLEPSLKIFSNIQSWLNACVACERAVTVFKGISFNKQLSQRAAKYVSVVVILLNVCLYIPQYLHLHLYEDKKEERTFCVLGYSPMLDHYNSFSLFFHLFVPFLINLISSIFLIVGTTRQRTSLDHSSTFVDQFSKKFHQHRSLVISPLVLVILSFPRVILSFTLRCHTSSRHFYFNLFGYFCSFSPSILLLFIFVLPSAVYKTQLRRLFVRK